MIESGNVEPSRGPLRAVGIMRYIPALDGLRAIAILLVLVAHFQLVPKVHLLEKALFWFTGIGGPAFSSSSSFQAT